MIEDFENLNQSLRNFVRVLLATFPRPVVIAAITITVVVTCILLILGVCFFFVLMLKHPEIAGVGVIFVLLVVLYRWFDDLLPKREKKRDE